MMIWTSYETSMLTGRKLMKSNQRVHGGIEPHAI